VVDENPRFLSEPAEGTSFLCRTQSQGIFEHIFARVERQIRFVILFGGFNCVATRSHIFLTGAEETAYAHHWRWCAPRLTGQVAGCAKH
jgi:hypothetical protein